jgi:hypothetical protein
MIGRGDSYPLQRPWQEPSCLNPSHLVVPATFRKWVTPSMLASTAHGVEIEHMYCLCGGQDRYMTRDELELQEVAGCLPRIMQSYFVQVVPLLPHTGA